MAPKKKILIRIGSLRHGGAEKVLVTFLKNLPKDKYEIDLLLNLYSGKYLADVPDFVNVFYLNKGEMITTNRLQDLPLKTFRVTYQKILKTFPKLLYQFILKGKKYDLEFAAIHGIRDEILNSPYKSSKKIIWIHNDLSQVKGYNDAEIRKFFGYDKIMVISEKIELLFKNLAKTEEEKNKIIRIYNPLDTAEMLEKSQERALNYDFSSAVKTFISVGTVFPQKGFDRLINAHQKLLSEGLKHHLLIIGDGPDLEKTQHLIQDLGLVETITMLGFTTNPYPYFREADFYVLSSRYEGFPTVLFEAITLKKRIIATDVSGAREILNGGKLGLIIENSEEAIYEGMKKALEKPESFNEYLENLENYEIPFTLEKSVKSIMKIIDEC